MGKTQAVAKIVKGSKIDVRFERAITAEHFLDLVSYTQSDTHVFHDILQYGIT